MTKAIFITASHSIYKDEPGEVYHFPRLYLGRVEQTIGDWVIFYEGRRAGGRGYYAVQRVISITPDPTRHDHYFAALDRSSLLGFEHNVPRLRPNGAPYETGLPLVAGANTAAVRLISDQDFDAILSQGLRDALPHNDTNFAETPAVHAFAEAQALFNPPALGAQRALVLSSRAFRDRSFARQVKRAYGVSCAISGLAFVNPAGKAEVQAAHIIPVECGGPDIVQNGMPLSATLHWLFDEGLISIGADYRILTADAHLHNEDLSRLIRPERKLILPPNPADHPHPEYLAWHRSERFKGA